ncbi:MAG: LamG domain-containing protein [Minicystis sp.]
MRHVSRGSCVRRSRLLRSAAVLSLLVTSAAACSNVDPEADLGEAEQALASTSVATTSVGAGGGSTGAGGAGGQGGQGGAGGSQALGIWTFDDCSPSSTSLADNSGNGHTATRSTDAACATGIDGLGIAFDNKKDTVTVPSLASFTFGKTLTAAAWVNPTSLSGVHSIINRQGNGQSSTFDLAIRDGKIEFSVTLSNGAVVTTSAPIASGAWVHVAGVYDGTFAFLFINGQQVGQVSGAGTLKNANAPVRIGTNNQGKVFAGFDRRRLPLRRGPGLLRDLPALVHPPPEHLHGQPGRERPGRAGHHGHVRRRRHQP